MKPEKHYPRPARKLQKLCFVLRNPATKTINIEGNTNIIFTAKEIKERNRIYQ